MGLAVPTLHDPVAVIFGMLAPAPVSFDVAVTGKLVPLADVAGAPVKLIVGVTFTALTFSLAVAAEYTLSAGHCASTVQVPVPLAIVTVVPLSVQTVLGVTLMVAVVLAFVAAVTVKADSYAADVIFWPFCVVARVTVCFWTAATVVVPAFTPLTAE